VKWTWEYMRERRDDRRAYIRVWKIQKSGGGLSIADSAMLFQLERKLGYEDLRCYRSMASSQLKKEKLLLSTAVESAAGSDTGTKTWTEYLWGSASEASGDSKTVFTQEQMKQLFETIEYDPDGVDASELPKDAVVFDVRWKLGTGSFTLKRKGERMLDMVFQRLSSRILSYTEGIRGIVELGGMECSDGTTPGTLYPHLVRFVLELFYFKSKEM
jgi:vacuolar protein sorting-associated protein 13A/C